MSASRPRLGFAIIAGAAIAALAFSLDARVARALDSPQRVVSLNICTDELALRLIKPHRIASITWLSRQQGESNIPDLTTAVPINHGAAEEVVAAQPDLVLAGKYTTRVAIALLKRIGLRIAEFDIPHNFDEVRSQIREAATLLNAQDEGERLVADIDVRLARVANDPLMRRPTAVVLNPNGVTVGKGSLVDQIMTAAGFDNIGAELSLGSYGQIPLEVVALRHVEVLIVSAAANGPPALATEILRHPVLAKLPQTRMVTVPGRLWGCAGPAVADAVEYLHQVATDVVAGKTSPVGGIIPR